MSTSVLIAEDYDDNRELLRLLLTTAGYEVREAKDGRECLRLAREDPPNLIMIDLSMPILDGWEVFSALRGDNLTDKIPCVAVTAYTDPDRQRALDAGFDGFLPKPFRTEELLQTVARLVSRKDPALT
ncbi:MAG: response regulator [Pyrinomonadaceae bacterium]